MACEAIHSWTLSKLIGAFLDLAVAYVLLWCSTVAYFVSKFIGFFGFSLPCPCNGVLSKPNPNHCLQKLLVDCPPDKISAVQLSVACRLPFDSVWERNEMKKLERGVIELEAEASGNSVFAAKSEGSAVAERGDFDVKGKGLVWSRKQRGNLRRRRKLSTEHTKVIPNSSYHDVQSGAAIPPLSKYGNSDTEKEYSDSFIARNSHDVLEPSHVMELDHKSWLSSESNGAMETNKYEDKDVGLMGSKKNDKGQNVDHDGHLENAVKILEQALKEERSARAALIYDLEKERTAAATAADEAMAMIARLQEEKAAIELEARQYERILEEKSTYDADEMDILQEIIIRQEMEKHFLEKEVESYKKMIQEKEQLEEDAFNGAYIQGASPEEKKSSTSHDQGFQEKSIVLIGEMKNEEETESNEHYDNGKSSVDHERHRLENEVGWLREKLRNIQEGRRKLNFSKEHRDKGETELLLLQDIGNLLHEIRQLTEPHMTMRRTSLPPPSSKDTSMKRCCRSES